MLPQRSGSPPPRQAESVVSTAREKNTALENSAMPSQRKKPGN